MKKERHINNNTITFLLTALLSGFLIFICIIALTEKFIPKFETKTHFVLYVSCISIILILSSIIFLSNLYQSAYLHYINYRKKVSDLRCIQRVNKYLGNNFSNVKLKDWDTLVIDEIIPEDAITCIAKLEEDGTIVYKVSVEIEMCTNDYQWFLRRFKV